MLKTPVYIIHLTERAHLPAKMEFQRRWDGARNATTLDSSDNRRARKACLKDSIVFGPAGPEQSAKHYIGSVVCQTTGTAADI